METVVKVVKVGKTPYVERVFRPKVEGCEVGKVGLFPKFNTHKGYILELFEFPTLPTLPTLIQYE